MKYSLVTRDLIADSTEAMAIAHQFDALVMVPNCDKNVPGLLMAAARMNVPTVFVSGGPMLAGHVKDRRQAFPVCLRQWVPMQQARCRRKMCLTMNRCLSDLRFLFRYVYRQQYELSDRSHRHGPSGQRHNSGCLFRTYKLAKHAGMKVMELLEKNIRPRDIMTKKAFMNALTVDMALGCSTNSMLHLPAIAHEAGVEIDLDIANELSAKTPNLCHLAPAGPTYMEDLNEAGGVYAVMNELNKKGLLYTD